MEIVRKYSVIRENKPSIHRSYLKVNEKSVRKVGRSNAELCIKTCTKLYKEFGADPSCQVQTQLIGQALEMLDPTTPIMHFKSVFSQMFIRDMHSLAWTLAGIF